MHVRLYISIFIIFLSLITSPAAQPASKTDTSAPFKPERVQRQKKRFELSKIDQIINILGIKEGMVILDIGTGSGQYACAFAKSLKGTGKVFATDISPRIIQHVAQEAKKDGLKNLQPVLVNAEGVDEFYGKQKYDLIFIARGINHIPEIESFLTTMKGFLAPGGRLVLLAKKVPDPFVPEDIKDVPGLLVKITTLPPNSPFTPYLATFKSEANGIKVTPELTNKLANIFNEICSNKTFYQNFLSIDGTLIKENLPLASEEIDWINAWLKGPRNLGLTSTSHWMNQIFLYREFGKYFLNNNPPCMPGGKTPSVTKPPLKTFKKAGLTLEKEYDFIPFHILLVFKAAR